MSLRYQVKLQPTFIRPTKVVINHYFASKAKTPHLSKLERILRIISFNSFALQDTGIFIKR